MGSCRIGQDSTVTSCSCESQTLMWQCLTSTLGRCSTMAFLRSGETSKIMKPGPGNAMHQLPPGMLITQSLEHSVLAPLAPLARSDDRLLHKAGRK